MIRDAEVVAGCYQVVLGSEGQAVVTVLEDIARVGLMGQTTFVPGDPHLSAFNEGKRALALYILGRAGVPVRTGGET